MWRPWHYIGRTVAGITFCWFSFFARSGVWKNCLGRQFGIWCFCSGGRLGMPSGYACPCCAFRGLRPWSSYAGTLALQKASFCNWEGWMLRPWPLHSMCCCRAHFWFFLPRNGRRKKASHRKWTCAIWGLETWFQGFLKNLRPTIWPQQKISSHRKGNENLGHGFPCFVDCENWEEQLSNFWRTTKNESIVLFFCFQKVAQLRPCFFRCTGSFQALASPYQAAAGHQKIQPQEMRIGGLGLRNCFREFSGTCVPLSGRSRPPKNPATGNENLGLGLAKLF